MITVGVDAEEDPVGIHPVSGDHHQAVDIAGGRGHLQQDLIAAGNRGRHTVEGHGVGRRRGIEEFAEDYIVKPFDGDNLVLRIKRVLGKY